MGNKKGENSIRRERLAADRAFRRECERFNLLMPITDDNYKTIVTDSIIDAEKMKFYQQNGWRYCPAWKSFFSPPVHRLTGEKFPEDVNKPKDSMRFL